MSQFFLWGVWAILLAGWLGGSLWLDYRLRWASEAEMNYLARRAGPLLLGFVFLWSAWTTWIIAFYLWRWL